MASISKNTHIKARLNKNNGFAYLPKGTHVIHCTQHFALPFLFGTKVFSNALIENASQKLEYLRLIPPLFSILNDSGFISQRVPTPRHSLDGSLQITDDTINETGLNVYSGDDLKAIKHVSSLLGRQTELYNPMDAAIPIQLQIKLDDDMTVFSDDCFNDDIRNGAIECWNNWGSAVLIPNPNAEAIRDYKTDSAILNKNITIEKFRYFAPRSDIPPCVALQFCQFIETMDLLRIPRICRQWFDYQQLYCLEIGCYSSEDLFTEWQLWNAQSIENMFTNTQRFKQSYIDIFNPENYSKTIHNTMQTHLYNAFGAAKANEIENVFSIALKRKSNKTLTKTMAKYWLSELANEAKEN